MHEQIVLTCVLSTVGGERNLFVGKEGASQKRLGNTVLKEQDDTEIIPENTAWQLKYILFGFTL